MPFLGVDVEAGLGGCAELFLGAIVEAGSASAWVFELSPRFSAVLIRESALLSLLRLFLSVGSEGPCSAGELMIGVYYRGRSK